LPLSGVGSGLSIDRPALRGLIVAPGRAPGPPSVGEHGAAAGARASHVRTVTSGSLLVERPQSSRAERHRPTCSWPGWPQRDSSPCMGPAAFWPDPSSSSGARPDRLAGAPETSAVDRAAYHAVAHAIERRFDNRCAAASAC